MSRTTKARSLYSLFTALHELRATQQADRPDANEEAQALQLALDSAVSLTAEMVGRAWVSADSAAVRRDIGGVEDVFGSYGLLNIQELKALESFRKALREAIVLPLAEGRPLVNSLLDSQGLRHPFIERVDRSIDAVNLGTLKWERFVASMAKLLAKN